MKPLSWAFKKINNGCTLLKAYKPDNSKWVLKSLFCTVLNSVYEALCILRWENLFIFVLPWDFSTGILFFFEDINYIHLISIY